MRSRPQIRVGVVLVGLLAASACKPAFRAQAFDTNESLYAAAVAERTAGREDNAIQALERLQMQLPPSDTLLPIVHQALGDLHAKKKQWLLAGQTYLRVTENFPDHPLADDALLAAGDAFSKLWRRPELDSKYGLEALATYDLLIRQYPSSANLTAAGAGAARIRQMLGEKDLLVGMHYYRRKAYDSAIIYFEGAATRYAGTDAARDALLMIVRSYRVLKYQDDAAETCTRVRTEYPNDPKVDAVCPAG